MTTGVTFIPKFKALTVFRANTICVKPAFMSNTPGPRTTLPLYWHPT